MVKLRYNTKEIRKMNIKKLPYILSLILLITISSCSKSEENIPADIEINDFVWKGMNAWYLWQADIPDLQDTRFSSQEQLNNYLADFATPEQLFENLLNRPDDRFSVIVDDYIALENSFQGITLTTGMQFGLVRYASNSSNVYGYVRYVVPNSPAANENITRGMIFNEVDGVQLTDANFGSLLFGSNTSLSLGFADYNNGNPSSNGTSSTVSKVQLQENPIAISKVITDGTQKIGYLLYNQFAATFNNQLNDAFASFKAENINDLIFAGKVISIEQIPKQNKKVFIGGYLKVTLEVKEVFKGKLSTKKIDVYTSSSGASCGYNFIRGESYLVYNQQYENKFHTGLCSRNQNLNSLKEREKKILRRLRKA